MRPLLVRTPPRPPARELHQSVLAAPQLMQTHLNDVEGNENYNDSQSPHSWLEGGLTTRNGMHPVPLMATCMVHLHGARTCVPDYI